MTAIEVKELKKEVKRHIDLADERMLKAVYAMLEADQEEYIPSNAAFNELESDYSDEYKAELNSRYQEYKNGGKLISEEDANKRIRNNIRK